MTVKVETKEDIRREVTEELINLACKALDKVLDHVHAEEWDRAIGALSTIRYVLEAAKEWK